MNAPAIPYSGLTPVFLLLGGALAIMLLDAFLPRIRKALAWISAAVVVAAGAALAWNPVLTGDETRTLLDLPGTTTTVYLGFGVLVLLGALGAVLMAGPYLGRHAFLRGEFFAMILFSASGGLMLAAGRNLIFLFLALEILTVPLFVLAAYYRTSRRGLEAGVKYFLVGIFCSAFLLYGIALFYGATGTLDLQSAAFGLGEGAARTSPLLRLSLGLLVVGIGFKIAAVPFHFWAPDVYQGAPTPVTAYLAVASKAGGFIFAWKVLHLGFPDLAFLWSGLLTWIAVATLVLGALLAMLQEDIKRLLAYSSIAHAGYALMGLIAQGRLRAGYGGSDLFSSGPSGDEALLVYLIIYAFAALGAFGVVSWLERSYGGPVRLQDYEGLARRRPWMAALLTLFLLSMAGMPPTAGFVAKLMIFWAALRSGAWLVAVVGALTAVVGMYYYLSVVVAMYFRPAAKGAPVPAGPAPALALVLLVAAAATLILGVWPGPVLEAVQQGYGSAVEVVQGLSPASIP